MSLRDRLRVMAPMVCEGCGCAIGTLADYGAGRACQDCNAVGLLNAWVPAADHEERWAAACVSVGLRALCGRRLLEGC